MAETLLRDDAQTVARLDSVACLLEWVRSMPAPDRKRFWGALADCSEAVYQVVVTHVNVVKDPRAKPAERASALTKVADALFPNPAEENGQNGRAPGASGSRAASQGPPSARETGKTDAQETFARRLRELMEAKRISQQELADRVGCSQPAVSQMLRRECRPQKKTILKLAEALNVPARELWPDLDVADMLDAVASFQQDDYVMTDAEARALADKSNKNRAKVRAKRLPTRDR
jgi:transcriptional regulator with XRE-family HTH domain